MYDEYTRDEYISEIFDRMKHLPKYRPEVKKLAADGHAECIDAMVLWNKYVKNMRRAYVGR